MTSGSAQTMMIITCTEGTLDGKLTCTAQDCSNSVPSGSGYSTNCDGLSTGDPDCTQTCLEGYYDR
eukprot:UN06828